MFFGDWLQRRAMLSPNKVALIDAVNGNQPITYREWNQRANRLAHFFRDALGNRKGDRVSIYSMNRVEYLDALFACNKLGAVLQVINWRLTVRELEDIVNDAAPRALLYSQELIEPVGQLRPRLRTVKAYVALDQRADDGDAHWPTERNNFSNTQPPPVELDWKDPWVICYTGGTTGLPKGAILHYRSITANSVNTVFSWGLRPDDVVPQYMPFFHTGGLNVVAQGGLALANAIISEAVLSFLGLGDPTQVVGAQCSTLLSPEPLVAGGGGSCCRRGSPSCGSPCPGS